MQVQKLVNEAEELCNIRQDLTEEEGRHEVAFSISKAGLEIEEREQQEKGIVVKQHKKEVGGKQWLQ